MPIGLSKEWARLVAIKEWAINNSIGVPELSSN